MSDLKKLTPFQYFVLTNFPFIEADFDALTNYQLMCEVTKYINQIAERQNETIDAFNDLEEDFAKLETVWAAFRTQIEYEMGQLYNWFENLDVQEQINNKLDQMASDGTLSDLVAPFIPSVVTAWLAEHITQPTTPVVDSSLTVSGAAADAKITGDRISDVNKALRSNTNLFNSENVANNKAFSVESETTVSVEGLFLSEYEAVRPNCYYVITPYIESRYYGIGFYDGALNLITGSSILNTPYFFVTPDNCHYIRFTGTLSAINNTKLLLVGNGNYDSISYDTMDDYHRHPFDKTDQIECVISNRPVSTSDGYSNSTDSGKSFSARFIYVPAGKTVIVHANNNYRFTVLHYDQFGQYQTYTAVDNNHYEYTASENSWLTFNVINTVGRSFATEDRKTESEFSIFGNYKNFDDEYSVISQVNIFPSDHDENKSIRIPTIKIAPNGNIICMYEVRDAWYDSSPSRLGCSIIRNGSIKKQFYPVEKLPTDKRQVNPQLYINSADEIILLYSAIDSESGLSKIYKSISEDYGETWATPIRILDDVSINILTSPSNGLNIDDNTILIPIYEHDINESIFNSGICVYNLTNNTHTEKYCAENGTNECVAIIIDDKILLSARNDSTTYKRQLFVCDLDLSTDFVLLSRFFAPSSSMRIACQEDLRYIDGITYNTRTLSNVGSLRYGIDLFASDCITRRSKKVATLSSDKYGVGGYSMIDNRQNMIATICEGGDRNHTGEHGKMLIVNTITKN